MQDNASKAKHHFRFELKNGRVRCFELNDGVLGVEVAASVNFAERKWRADPEACIEAASLPLVCIPVQPQTMPTELEGLADTLRLVLRDEIATYDVVTTAGKARKKAADAIERRRLGRLTAREVACLLSRLDGCDAQTHYEFLHQAFVDSEIVFRDVDEPIYASIDAPTRVAELKNQGAKSTRYLIHDEWAYTTATQVNKWLDKVDEDGLMPRLPTACELATPPAPPVVAVDDAPAPAWNLITSLERMPGYRWPLYQFLQAAHVSGKPCPKAQEVLDAWKLKPPLGLSVIQSGRCDELKYVLNHGGIKTADIKAIQAAIVGLVV